ncbi:alanine racemase [Microbulbifer harenosus]|uniref:Amino acid decarboxylase n=1 Tax=Microbulbifer harenosus TaxID=2576840 RepID=A0ABY2UKY7_9GAMM|nr:alanine racemase [Microbulbifer harenosus]TLM78133.1 amino acid decarboxylase [Microbulbifer harenosus]
MDNIEYLESAESNRHATPPSPFGAVPSRPFPLSARQHPAVAALLRKHPCFLSRLADGLGSPLHVLLPQVFAENVRCMREVFREHGLENQILYAKKANKADCFVHTAAQLGIGVDVASSGEFARTLAAGIPGDRIGVSGPEKDDALLTLSLQHRALIAIDTPGELERLAQLAYHNGTVASVLLRCRIASQSNSRFGLSPAERNAAVDLCLSHRGAVQLEGFSFHLGGYATDERARAANAMIDHCLDARSRGLTGCSQVNIGGGLPVQYVDPQQWADFLRRDARDHYHAHKVFGGFYPYGAARAGAQALHDILQYRTNTGESLSARAKRHGICFIAEPGRALLDQAGFTLFRVQAVKDRHAAEGYAILSVQGSSLSLSEQWFNSEYLPDPVLLKPGQPAPEPFVACVAGSTCLESDMLTWRKIGFPRAVLPGDQLVYINTAGYQMDSNESPFHEARLPSKVVLDYREDEQQPQWRLDGI